MSLKGGLPLDGVVSFQQSARFLPLRGLLRLLAPLHAAPWAFFTHRTNLCHRAPTARPPRAHRAPTARPPRAHRAPTGRPDRVLLSMLS